MATLPEDILLCKILPWLPSKILIRFRCVCKSWCSFIHNPSFLHLRKLTHNPSHHLLFFSPDPHASVVATSQPHVFSTPFHHGNTLHPNIASLLFTLPTNLKYSETRVQCVQGLLCFHPKEVRFSSHVDAFTLIANPTTRQVLALPPDSSIHKDEFLVSTHFGFEPVRDEFKVLRLIKYQGSHEFKILTLGESSWRVVVLEKPFAVMHCLLSRHKRGVCVNGAIHWTYSSSFLTNSSLGILAFDLATEHFRVMPAPLGYSFKEENVGHLQYPDLVEIDGCLCLVGYSVSGFKLWILRDYKSQKWEQKSVVIPSGVVSQQQVVFPLCRVLTGEILVLPYFLPRRVRGVYYDMDTMSSRIVVVVEMPQPLWPDKRSGEVDIFFCEESFRLLK